MSPLDPPDLAHAATITPAAPVSPASPPPAAVEPGDTSLADEGYAARYDAHRSLGQGGMGQVTASRDARIGREVAVKVVHPELAARADVRARFLREARIQGQIEHPCIVPVYDLGLRPDGLPFFTMKRVRGQTLADILRGLRAGDPDLAAKYGRRKLLTAFASVGLAVGFAHERGVVHRDLKPGNVMLGDFGEVYVLDWGLAKLAADATAAAAIAPAAPLSGSGSGDVTGIGQILGTPGYMAPEQIRGDAVDARADVYALGAILFEILTLEPLHAKGGGRDLLQATLAGADARAQARAPTRDVPPE